MAKLNRRSFLGTSAAAGIAASGVFSEAMAATKEPVAETAYGKVRGTALDGVLAFRGVPYGAPTSGENRFMPAKKPQPWTGIKDCIELGPRAPQAMPGPEPPEVLSTDRMEPIGEDCLVLNVWTPGTRGKRPVMVWLHGGGFAAGSAGYSIYDGANMARKQDVVFVGINHRLNVFGFLYLAEIGGPKYADASNVGQTDIVAALQWVHDNIARFGGDPGNVTVMGQSGGAGKVSTLLAMPSAKGLFHRAIVQSGSAVRGVPKEAATKQAQAVLAKLNLKPDQIDQLQKIPMKELIDATKAGFGWAPVVDGKTLPANPFDPKAPEVSADIPVMFGTNETEMTFFSPGPLFPYQLDDMDDAALHENLKKFLRADDADTDRTIAVYKRVHPQSPNIDIFLKATADFGVRNGVLTEADRKAAQHKAPVYVYYFAWRSPVRSGKLKSYHTLEIPFAFENVDVAKSMTGDGPERYALQDRVSGAWAAFARTGNPWHKGLPKWPAYDTDARATMIFDNECKVVNDPHKEERMVIATVKRTPGGPF